MVSDRGCSRPRWPARCVLWARGPSGFFCARTDCTRSGSKVCAEAAYEGGRALSPQWPGRGFCKKAPHLVQATQSLADRFSIT